MNTSDTIITVLVICANIEELQEKEDPSMEEMADLSLKLSIVIQIMGGDDEDPMMVYKAGEYSNMMKRLSRSIYKGDEEEIALLVAEMNKGSGL